MTYSNIEELQQACSLLYYLPMVYTVSVWFKNCDIIVKCILNENTHFKGLLTEIEIETNIVCKTEKSTKTEKTKINKKICPDKTK